MILLLGASGYVGKALASAMSRRGLCFRALSRTEADYTDYVTLKAFLARERPAYVLNAAGYTGKPNLDACETRRAETLLGNVFFPQMLAIVCADLGIPLGQVSSGCIYAGCLVEEGGEWNVVKDVNRPDVRRMAKEAPHRLRGFDEEMTPNFSFRDGPCSFYSGTKALGEEVIRNLGRQHVWRLRIPFDERDGARNYVSKLIRYERVYDALNSISHLGDFADACLDCVEKAVSYGTYNVVNPGFVSARDVVELIRAKLLPERVFRFWADDEEFYRSAAVAPRSNCLLDPGKLLRAGIRLRPVSEALEDALDRWQPEAEAAVR